MPSTADIQDYKGSGLTPSFIAENRAPAERADNATLRKDEWERIDDAVVDVMRERLTVVGDLMGRGLTTDVDLGVIHRVVERLQDVHDAELSMDGDTDPQRDRVGYASQTFPVPVISQDFRIAMRQLESSRTRGSSLQADNAEAAARSVREKQEDLVINGATIGPAGNDLKGISNGANELTTTLSNNWDVSAGTPIADTVTMLNKAYENNLSGPFVMYVPNEYWATVQDDYSDNKGDRTIQERIEAFADIDAVRPAYKLSDNNVLLIQMTGDVVDLTVGQEPTTVQWEKNPMVTNFRVFSVMSPAVKTIELEDGTAINGIVHHS